MVNLECLLESTKKDLLDVLDNGNACIRLKSIELGKRKEEKDKGQLRLINRALYGLEIMRKDIEDIPICQK